MILSLLWAEPQGQIYVRERWVSLFCNVATLLEQVGEVLLMPPPLSLRVYR